MSMEELQADIIALHAMEQSEKRVNAQLAALKTDIRLVEVRILQTMQEMGLDSIGHAGILAKIKRPIHYSPAPGDGWQRIYARIQRTGEWELIQKRLSSTAVRERFKAGDEIDGVQAVMVPELDLTLQGGA